MSRTPAKAVRHVPRQVKAVTPTRRDQPEILHDFRKDLREGFEQKKKPK